MAYLGKKAAFFGIIIVFMTPLVSADFFTTSKTLILQGTSTSGGGGGNPFDQSLNTTDDVIFRSMNSTKSFIQSGLTIGNDTRSVGNAVVVQGNYTGAIVSGSLDMIPKFYGSGTYAVVFGRPAIYRSLNDAVMFYFSPTFNNGVPQKATGLFFDPPDHVKNVNDQYRLLFTNGVPRTFLAFSGADADSSTVTYNWVTLGDSVSFGDLSTTLPTYSETMITLKGGASRALGSSGSITQKGISFTGFGTKTNLVSGDSVTAISADGGDFLFTGNSIINTTNLAASTIKHTGGLPSTGGNAGSNVCIDANNQLCACGSCA